MEPARRTALPLLSQPASSPVHEPERQMEIQLGHMCNNRCVFCVSGQRTAQREAFPLQADPIEEKIREGFEQGMRKLTILGGEPTIQPEFLRVVKYAVGLGFDEIVIFTNGVKTARAAFLDEILATGGNFTFRLSFQGANRLAHERTTKKLGSFDRLVETMRNIHERGERLTVNMCVVRSNYESVAEFPALLLPFGARQLHLDMVRPLDAGVRTEEELRDMLPRYSDLVPPLERMIAGFPEGFDVNIGNLPYCVAPGLAPWIHHDGEQTLTVAVDEQDTLSEGWDKYQVKRRDKLKKESCRECVFDAECSGVFETYRHFHGLDELVPVTAERLRVADPALRLFTLHLRPLLARLDGWTPRDAEGYGAPSVHVDSRRGEASLRFQSDAGEVVVSLVRSGVDARDAVAATELFAMRLVAAPDCGPRTVALLRALLHRLCEGGGLRVVHPVGEDAGAMSGASRRRADTRGEPWIDPRLLVRLRLLRERAPFGALDWTELSVRDGREATLTLRDPRGEEARVTLAVRGAQVTGGYQLGAATPSPEMVAGLRALLGILR